jgi:hypothetical protein
MKRRRGVVSLCGLMMLLSGPLYQCVGPLRCSQGMKMGESGQRIFSAESVSFAVHADPPFNPEGQMSLALLP